VLITGGLLLIGLLAMVITGALILRDLSDIPVAAWIGYVFGHAFATMGLAMLISSLTSQNVTRSDHRSDHRSANRTRRVAGRRTGFQLTLSDAGLPGVIIFAVSAAALLAISVVVRSGMDPTSAAAGAIASVVIGYWAYHAFRRHQRERSNAGRTGT
jgi:membrane protein implicated in regulation of membrane protease activity